MRPGPDQQPGNAAGCSQGGVVGEHPGQEEVSAGAVGSAQAYIQHLVAPLGQ